MAGRQKLRFSPDATIDAEVDLGTTDGAYGLAARLKVSLPGTDRETAQALVDGAHQVCTYSRATRGMSTSRSRWSNSNPRRTGS